jgi:hypothetical protein
VVVSNIRIEKMAKDQVDKTFAEKMTGDRMCSGVSSSDELKALFLQSLVVKNELVSEYSIEEFINPAVSE